MTMPQLCKAYPCKLLALPLKTIFAIIRFPITKMVRTLPDNPRDGSKAPRPTPSFALISSPSPETLGTASKNIVGLSLLDQSTSMPQEPSTTSRTGESRDQANVAAILAEIIGRQGARAFRTTELETALKESFSLSGFRGVELLIEQTKEKLKARGYPYRVMAIPSPHVTDMVRLSIERGDTTFFASFFVK